MYITNNNGISLSNFSNVFPSSTSIISTAKKSALLFLAISTLPTTEGMGFGIVQNVVEGVVSFANFVYPHITYAKCVFDCKMIYPSLDWQYELCLRGCEAFRNQF